MITNTYEQLLELYRRCPARSMQADLEFYMRTGYVFSSPDYILIGRRIGDGWHIHVAVGTNCLKKFLELMPYHLPYIGWAREAHGDATIRWRRTEDLIRIINQSKQHDHEKRQDVSATAP